MTTTRQHKSVLMAAVASLAFAAFLFIPSSANAGTFDVSPPKFDYTVQPGDVVRDVMQFVNNTSQDVQLNPAKLNFTQAEGDETTGSPESYPADEVRTGTELAPWIEMSEEPVLVKGGERANFAFTIRIPEDAQPGGHFGMIEVLAAGPGQKEGVGVTGGLASLIFVRVEGDVNDALSIDGFRADGYSYSSLPVNFSVRAVNGGNSHLRPVGQVFVRNMFGKQVAAISVNPNFQTVLPGYARRLDVSWEKRRVSPDASELSKQMKNFALGKYEATLALNYGDGKVLTEVISFVVIPWLALAVWAVIILLAIVVLVFGFKGYNKMIIRKYQKMQK